MKKEILVEECVIFVQNKCLNRKEKLGQNGVKKTQKDSLKVMLMFTAQQYGMTPRNAY